jgi:hypothetical protein
MQFIRFLSLFLLTFSSVQAQDERYFRKLFTGELTESGPKEKLYKWQVSTPLYKLDLNGDKKDESIVVSKKDGEDWIELFDHLGTNFFSGKLQAKGDDSSLFKIQLITLSEKTKVLVLHYYEGITKYKEFNGSGKIYLITFEDNKFDSIQMTEGLSFWIERALINERYFKREYYVEALDLNLDGTKEIRVRFNSIKRVLFYKGKGNWATI